LKTSDFDFELPPELIAQAPCPERRGARLLVHDPSRTGPVHATVAELGSFLRAGDLLVVNDTRVRRARIRGTRPGGGRVELLLVRRAPGPAACWAALARPASRLRPGMRIELPGGAHASALERERSPDGGVGPEWWFELDLPAGLGEEEWIESVGELPLPPYVRRPEGEHPEDAERYQTVYARNPGAVAAPTAGLHLDHELLAALEQLGVRRASVTLHVGPGTFRPVESEDPRDHPMHSEVFELPLETAQAVEDTRRAGGRVVAVGTTSARVLESRATAEGGVSPGQGETDLFLYPGRPVRVVDALLTNFHLPRSTLLMLVAALIGRERVLELYREAIERRYRFFSYGDAMLLISPRVGRARA
jgi:S-adenosylmethionine:tRNA ribosyltransferase-isomerase